MDPFTASAILAGAGGLLDAGFGLWGDVDRAREQRRALRDLKQALATSEQLEDVGYAQRAGSLESLIGAVDPAGETYARAFGYGERALDPRRFEMQPGEFEYGKTAEQFLDPYRQYAQDQMRRQVEASAAAGGGLLSGGALKELQSRAEDLANQRYGDAYARMVQDKDFAYRQFGDKFARERQLIADKYQMAQGEYNRLLGQGGLAESFQDEYDANRMAQQQMRSQMAQQRGNLAAQGQFIDTTGDLWRKGLQRFGGAAMQGVGSYLSGLPMTGASATPGTMPAAPMQAPTTPSPFGYFAGTPSTFTGG